MDYKSQSGCNLFDFSGLVLFGGNDPISGHSAAGAIHQCHPEPTFVQQLYVLTSEIFQKTCIGLKPPKATERDSNFLWELGVLTPRIQKSEVIRFRVSMELSFFRALGLLGWYQDGVLVVTRMERSPKPSIGSSFLSLRVGGNSNIFNFHPGSLGKWSDLTSAYLSKALVQPPTRLLSD